MSARYPELRFPPDKDPSTITLKDVVDSNRQRRIALVGPSIDNSVDGSYGYIRRGLVSSVEPVTKSFDLAAVAAENDVLMRKYQPPSPAMIKRGTFEPQLLRSYAAAAEWIGTRYKQAGRPNEAASWYRRALEVDPDHVKARSSLDEIVRK
jgi:tetratricopeptide (TPR) repeat protein